METETKNIGDCLHLISGFICSCGKHQNYPCPHKTNFTKCSGAVIITEDMAEQWKSQGYIIIHNVNL